MVSIRTLAAVLLAFLAFGCGAKTGLDLPDGSVDANGPTDAGMDSAVDSMIPCVEVPLDGGPIDLPLETQAQVGRADVLFLIDVTASMNEEIDRIRDQLRDRLAPALERNLTDTRISIATFGDFPIDPYGNAEMGDNPFELIIPMTDDLALTQAALSLIHTGNGRDEPESHVEALYQVATGAGLSGHVPPSFGCPMGGFGYPCFRDDALPVILLFSDAPFHNGPGGSEPYRGISPRPHTYAEALAELNSLGVRVISFNSGSSGETYNDLARIATDTGARGAGGQPLIFDVGSHGENLGTEVVGAIELFAEAVVFDVDALLVDPDRSDGVDVTSFVEAVVPVSADPPEGVREIDTAAGVFRGVVSGTNLLFQLRLRNDAIVPGPVARRFLLEIVFRGDGRTLIDRRTVEIVIPGADGAGCTVR